MTESSGYNKSYSITSAHMPNEVPALNEGTAFMGSILIVSAFGFELLSFLSLGFFA